MTTSGGPGYIRRVDFEREYFDTQFRHLGEKVEAITAVQTSQDVRLRTLETAVAVAAAVTTPTMTARHLAIPGLSGAAVTAVIVALLNIFAPGILPAPVAPAPHVVQESTQ